MGRRIRRGMGRSGLRRGCCGMGRARGTIRGERRPRRGLMQITTVRWWRAALELLAAGQDKVNA